METSKNILCFYHNADLDGLCSAAIVNKFVSGCDFYGINYGDKFPWDIIDNYEEIIFVDWTLQPFEELIKVTKMKSTTIIDHHKSVVEEYELHQNEIQFMGQIRSGKAACEVCWEYFAIGYGDLPLGVYLIGRYDVWELDINPNVLPFQYGMKARINSYNDSYWQTIFSSDFIVRKVAKEGEAIILYQQKQDKKYSELFAKATEFEGHKAIVINKGQTNSQLFEQLINCNDYPLWISYIRLPSDKWTVSLYSKTIDVSVIAKKYGGGGHKGASGFQCKELPFKY